MITSYVNTPLDVSGRIFGNFVDVDNFTLSELDFPAVPVKKLTAFNGSSRSYIDKVITALRDTDKGRELIKIVDKTPVIDFGAYYTNSEVVAKFLEDVKRRGADKKIVNYYTEKFSKNYVFCFIYTLDSDTNAPRILVNKQVGSLLGAYHHNSVQLTDVLNQEEIKKATNAKAGFESELIDLNSGITSGNFLRRINYGNLFEPSLVNPWLGNDIGKKDYEFIMASVNNAYTGFLSVRNTLNSTVMRPNVTLLDDLSDYATNFNIKMDKFKCLNNLVLIEYLGNIVDFSIDSVTYNDLPLKEGFKKLGVLASGGSFNYPQSFTGTVNIRSSSITVRVEANSKTLLVKAPVIDGPNLDLTIDESFVVAMLFLDHLRSAIAYVKDVGHLRLLHKINIINNVNIAYHNSGSLYTLRNLGLTVIPDVFDAISKS